MRIPALLSLIALAACQQDATMTSNSDAADLCNASAYQHLVGSPANEADFAEAHSLRITSPGMAVTMDYRPDRLNVETDDTGIITRIRCG